VALSTCMGQEDTVVMSHTHQSTAVVKPKSVPSITSAPYIAPLIANTIIIY